jgi:hypothetical protein
MSFDGRYPTKKQDQQITNTLKRGGHRVLLKEIPESGLLEEAAREVGEEEGAKTSQKKSQLMLETSGRCDARDMTPQYQGLG